MEILFFALLSLYIGYRLWSVLGERTGNEKPRRGENGETLGEEENNVIPLPQRHLPKIENVQGAEANQETRFFPDLAKIRQYDPDFSLDHFMEGAKIAFTMIIEGFAEGNLSSLNELLTEEVYQAFSTAIQEREKKGQTVETSVDSIDKTEITSVVVHGIRAEISVKFITHQTIVTVESDGQIHDNPAKISQRLKEVWTFTRNLESDNPNWALSKTKIGD